MSLKHALLGLLTYTPMTGYDLKRVFDSSVHFIWNAELSQIYPTLKNMESEGLLEMRVEPQEDRPNRKVYSVTERGQAELQRWLLEPAEPALMRDAFLVKVFFGSRLPPGIIAEHLRRQVEAHRERLAHYRTVTTEELRAAVDRGSGKRVRDGFFWRLTLDMAIRFEEAYIAWCEDTLRRLEEMPELAGALEEAHRDTA